MNGAGLDECVYELAPERLPSPGHHQFEGRLFRFTDVELLINSREADSSDWGPAPFYERCDQLYPIGPGTSQWPLNSRPGKQITCKPQWVNAPQPNNTGILLASGFGFNGTETRG